MGLAAPVKANVPSSSAAVLVGSAVAGRGGCVADLDVTALDATVAPGQDRAHEFVWERWPVHVVSYHPLHFHAVARNDQLLFVFMREIRKLREGMVLFDQDGQLRRIKDDLETISIPYRLLRPLAQAGLGDGLTERDRAAQRVELYFAIENLTYAWMHLDMAYRYAKPKWLLADAQLVDSEHLLPLLREISQELIDTHDLRELTGAVRQQTDAASLSSTVRLARGNVSDSEALLKEDRKHEAVWPLRMAAYMLARAWTQNLAIHYDDLRAALTVRNLLADRGDHRAQLLSDVLLLDCPPRANLLRRWDAARREFQMHWARAVPRLPLEIL